MLHPVLPAAAGHQRPLGLAAFPSAVDLDRSAQVLTIEWDDGATTRLDGRTLRWACPCAECRGEFGEPGKLDRAESLSPDEEHVEDVWLVGQYALGISFRSGHATGIYTFDLLRRLGLRAG